MSRSIIALCIAALTLAALAGCGGSSSGDDTASGSNVDTTGGLETIETSSMTKPQFIKAADEICRTRSENFLPAIIGYIQQHSDSAQSEGEVTAEGVRKVLLPNFQLQIDEIRELGAPAGDEEEIVALLSAMQKAVESLDKRNEVSLATDIDREFQPAGELALDYGLQVCAN